jgi:hypothetical protein
MAVLNLKIDIKYLYLSFAYSITVLYKNILKNEKNEEMKNFHEKINVSLHMIKCIKVGLSYSYTPKYAM